MNRETLTRLAKQADLMGRLLDNYPDPADPEVTFPPSPYYRFFYLLAKETQPKLSVELGVCGGGGSLHLAMADAGRVVGVDLTYAEYYSNMRWLGKNYWNLQLLEGDSVELAPLIFADYGKIDFLFIDTTHTYERTMAEYKAYQPFLSAHAIICLDDLFRPGMDRAWSEMPENKLRLDFLHPSQSPTDGGFGVIWT
jgi:predicted O-methyltransferase YrrM